MNIWPVTVCVYARKEGDCVYVFSTKDAISEMSEMNENISSSFDQAME